MDKYIFHINPYDIVFIGTIVTGLVFALLLIFIKRSDQVANLFLGLALAIVVLWMMGLPVVGIQPDTYWSRLPLHFSLALGPLLYFYVLQKTKPERIFRRIDLSHFGLLLLEPGSWLLQVKQLNLVMLLLAFISVTVYLFRSYNTIKTFRRWLRFNAEDEDKYQLRWLQHLLGVFGIMWVAWMLAAATSRFFYHQPGIIFYALSIVLTIVITVIGASALLRPVLRMPAIAVLGLPTELAQKGGWLRRSIAAGLLYQDPDLSLNSLGKAIGVHPHELSRIINLAIGKNFNDLINEYRVLDVKQKMQDPAYDRLTLLGIAQSSGFNSRATFNRAFRQITGKSAVEYKDELKKVRSNHKLRQEPRFAPVISNQQTTPKWYDEKLNRNIMFKNYLKITWRNLVKNKSYSALNIAGLATGMAVAMLIGLWIWDELSFNKYYQNYDRIASVMQRKTFNGQVNTGGAMPLPVESELRKSYGSDFKHIFITFWNDHHTLVAGERKVSYVGTYVSAEAPEALSLKMIRGSRSGLNGPSGMLISQSVSNALFGSENPMGKLIKMDDKDSFAVSGVYEDMPATTSLHDVQFMVPWDYFLTSQTWLSRAATDWSDDSFQLYVQLADNVDMATVSAKIKDIKQKKAPPAETKAKPEIFLQPMSKWHLYSEFKNGVNTGGGIQYVWLFGIIGVFVLLLACINFMNLSTARSQKRAKEVGVRKAIGSLKGQLVTQFYCESMLIALLSFSCSLILVQLALPFFNDMAGKQMAILWSSPLFWITGICFTLFTGLIAGSYPALYLSSFNPVTVLKGTFKAGRLAAIPRKVLVVVQFAVSVILIIGTIVVFKQIQFAKNIPVGYTRAGLIDMGTGNHALDKQFYAFRSDLIKSGAVTEVTESSSSATAIHNNRSDVTWEGKDPSMAVDFASVRVTSEYGKALGWKLEDGRDFSAEILTDSNAVILNEAAVKYMGLKKPIGAILNFGRVQTAHTVVGVVKDMVMSSPYEPARQTLFYIDKSDFDDIIIRINPKMSTHEAIDKIAAVCKVYAPSVPFAYSFVDDDYAKKFADEERIGTLATTLATLAIFISCLGLFGMASFMAEQRTKELGIRKVLGASVFGLWQLLSVDFIILVIIAFFIAVPVAWYSMHSWLQHYTYRADISWWIFAVTAAGAVTITLITVSYQSIKAALVNPVKSLKSE
ncbi:MAG: ABC transporter permease [Bacteroidota bacterium]